MRFVATAGFAPAAPAQAQRPISQNSPACFSVAPTDLPMCPLEHPSSRSRRVRRLEDRNRDRLAGGAVESLDTRSGINPQPDRLGAEREGALLTRLDEGEAATAPAQEIGSASGIGKMRARPGKKDQAGLLVADTGGDRMRARRIMKHFGERH